MEDWALRAMQRWPNVPALFGWLGLSRRGHWLIKGEIISRPQIVETINRNYQSDAYGRWFFQNGPQRGFIALEYAPFVLRAEGERLVTHTGLPVDDPSQAYLDEEGSLVFHTEHGAGLLVDTDLEWALARIQPAGRELDEESLGVALSLASGQPTSLSVTIAGRAVPVARLDRETVPRTLDFERDPQPREGEIVSTRIAD